MIYYDILTLTSLKRFKTEAVVATVIPNNIAPRRPNHRTPAKQHVAAICCYDLAYAVIGQRATTQQMNPCELVS